MKRVLLVTCFAALGLGQTGSWEVSAAQQTNDGHIYHLRGNAEMRGAEIVFHADQIDYVEDKATVHLTGHVSIETDTMALQADDVDYDARPAISRRVRVV